MFEGVKNLTQSRKSSVTVTVIGALIAMIHQEVISADYGATLVTILACVYVLAQGFVDSVVGDDQSRPESDTRDGDVRAQIDEIGD